MGANAALLFALTLARAHRHPVAVPVGGFAVFNIAPVLTVPLVFALTRVVHSDDAAFLGAGTVSVSCYVVLVAAPAAALSGRAVRRGRS